MQIKTYSLVGKSENEAKMYAQIQKLAPTFAHVFPRCAPEELPRLLMESLKGGALYIGIVDNKITLSVFVGNVPNSEFNILFFDATADTTEAFATVLQNALSRFQLNKISTRAIANSPLSTCLVNAGFRSAGVLRRETLIGDEYKDTVLLERLGGEEAEEPKEEDIAEILETKAVPQPVSPVEKEQRIAAHAGMDGGEVRELEFSMPRYGD